jgi:uracil-DNA glycosylase family 4
MDIFDAVTTWLVEKKNSGTKRIYLNSESKERLTTFIELSKDESKLNSWLQENNLDTNKVETSHEQTSEKEEQEFVESSQVIAQKLEVPQNETVASASKIQLPLPVPANDSQNIHQVPIESGSTKHPLNQPLPTTTKPYSFLKHLVHPSEILIIGEQLHRGSLTQPFEKSQSLLQEMIKAMDSVLKKNQNNGLPWGKISLVEICKEQDDIQDGKSEILHELSTIIQSVTPKVVLLMGALPTGLLTKTHQSILNIHGHWFNFQEVACMPTFHPDFLNRSTSRKKEAWADLKKVIQFLS